MTKENKGKNEAQERNLTEEELMFVERIKSGVIGRVDGNEIKPLSSHSDRLYKYIISQKNKQKKPLTLSNSIDKKSIMDAHKVILESKNAQNKLLQEEIVVLRNRVQAIEELLKIYEDVFNENVLITKVQEKLSNEEFFKKFKNSDEDYSDYHSGDCYKADIEE